MTTARSVLPVDRDRLEADIVELAAITDPAHPYTRRSFSPLFLEGRAWLRARLEAAGLATHLDAAGNLIGRREGSDPSAGTIVIGSHSDTVPGGGRFDGIAGVVAGLECARALGDHGQRLRHALEIVDFLAEEPSEYGISCIGSRGISGHLSDAELEMRNAAGETVREALRRVGGDPSRLGEARRDDIRAMFELHIEQGSVLEADAIEIGTVTGIVGITRLEIVFDGMAGHAGTAPMHRRRDALVAAARMVDAIRGKAEAIASRGGGYFVATATVLEVTPNAANVVPGRARMVIDARAELRPAMDEFLEWIDLESIRVGQSTDVVRASLRRLSDTQPAVCDPELQKLLRRSAQALGLSHRDIASGAGHDTAFLSKIAPAAMIFIPCLAGRSHCPEEWAEPQALAAGTAVIYEAVTRFGQA